MRRRRLLALGVLCLLATGCIRVADMAVPLCDGGEQTAVLMAQTVPSAALVPCVEAQPPGWFLSHADIERGRSELVFSASSDTGPESVLTVTLAPSCEHSDAVEVPSDEPGARQFEDIADITDGYRGDRFYVFEGGCVTYRFDLRGTGWSAKVHDASAALSFTSRSTLETHVRERSAGVIERL